MIFFQRVVRLMKLAKRVQMLFFNSNLVKLNRKALNPDRHKPDIWTKKPSKSLENYIFTFLTFQT